MSQITIDLNDSPAILNRVADFLKDVANGTLPVVEPVDHVTGGEEPPLIAPGDHFTMGDDPTIHIADPLNMPVVETPEPSSLEGVEFDSAGLPWDYRIHGEAKKTTAKDGKWKKIRGIDPEIVEKVETELRAVMAVPTPPVVEAPPAPTEPTPTPPAPPVDDTKMTFPELMSAITSAGITAETVTAAVVKHGLQALPLLAARPDLIPMVAAELGL